jgi:hypothetical protein
VTRWPPSSSPIFNERSRFERFTLRAPSNLAKFIAEKGSVCLDGTSLTVNSVPISARPSTWPVTRWPPSSSPIFNERSRLIRVPATQECQRALHPAGAFEPGQVHRREGLGLPRRHLAHGEFGLAFHDLGEAIDVAGDQMAAEFVADLQ